MDNEQQNKKILICGGHLTPAYITAYELQSRGFKNLLWVGRKFTQTSDSATSPEYQLVSELNIPFIHLETGKLWRKWNKFTFITAIKDLFLIPFGFIRSLTILIQEKPDLIISFGGYVAVPLVILGKFLRKKVITHEQVLKPGLSTKIISFFADKILLSWEETLQFVNKKKVEVTGNPSWAMFNKTNEETINFNNDLPIITIIGGNQGSNVINTAVFAILSQLLKFANVIHQTGRSEVTKDKYKASTIKAELPEELGKRYMFLPYIVDNIYEVFDKSDLIISRGGANTLTDLIAKIKKAIIIPIPWSSGKEQLENAKFLEKLGLGSIIQYEKEINPEMLLNEIKKQLKREVNLEKSKVKQIQSTIRYSPTKISKAIIEVLST